MPARLRYAPVFDHRHQRQHTGSVAECHCESARLGAKRDREHPAEHVHSHRDQDGHPGTYHRRRVIHNHHHRQHRLRRNSKGEGYLDRSTQNREPSPKRLSHPTVPPCNSADRFTKAKPMPVPGNSFP